ncbi:MAG TPA: hypothetical protein VIL35_07070 [Vicinamibacterales bacterium]
MKRWMWIVLGLVAFTAVGCFTVVGAGAWFLSRHVQVKEMPRDAIEAEFTELRARFGDQKPLLDTRRGVRVASERLEARASGYTGPLPERLCVLAWEVGDPRRARLCLPFWLLKIKSGKGLKLSVPDGSIGRIEISAEELERAGPALLLDEKDDRHRLIMWTE